MLNAIPAANIFGVNNPLTDQSAQSQIGNQIRTNNFEQLEARNVPDLKEDESPNGTHEKNDDQAEEDKSSYPPPKSPSQFDLLLKEGQDKVGQTQQAVTSFFLNAAVTPTPDGPKEVEAPSRPSIDVVA